MRPTLRVVKTEQTCIICESPGDNVMQPDEPNQPAGVREFGSFDWNE